MVECDGTPVVPSVEAAVSWVLQMAKGDPKCPKGGWVEYRNGAWYKLSFGMEQGTLMAARGAKEFGFGPHADQPCRFTTIEQKVSGLRMWYDEQLKNLGIANPFRNVKLLDVMSSLENTMGRCVAHKPSMILEPHLRAIQGAVDLENANEVNMVSYMSKNVVKGSRAQTEFLLDWEDVEFCEASGLRCAGAVYHNQSDKDNKSQRGDKAKKALHCTSTCKGKIERDADGKLCLSSFCPVHMDKHLRSLQACSSYVLHVAPLCMRVLSRPRMFCCRPAMWACCLRSFAVRCMASIGL